jgi:hypothetical protein
VTIALISVTVVIIFYIRGPRPSVPFPSPFTTMACGNPLSVTVLCESFALPCISFFSKGGLPLSSHFFDIHAFWRPLFFPDCCFVCSRFNDVTRVLPNHKQLIYGRIVHVRHTIQVPGHRLRSCTLCIKSYPPAFKHGFILTVTSLLVDRSRQMRWEHYLEAKKSLLLKHSPCYEGLSCAFLDAGKSKED